MEESETLQSLHDLYYQRQFQQQDAQRDTQSQSQSQYSQEYYEEDVAVNKFKSMEQITKKGFTRKKRQHQELNVRAPIIEPSGQVETQYLAGSTFMVLDGTYKLEENSLEMKQAKAEGWYNIASTVETVQDVINFIFAHGGKIVDCDPNLIIGGKVEDPKVFNYKRAIERAEEGINTSNKRDENLLKMIQLGVVKWTFLYATIHHLCKENDLQMTKKGKSLIPRKHDYLVYSKLSRNFQNNVEDVYGMHLFNDSNMFEFRRALEEVRIYNNMNKKLLQKRFKLTKDSIEEIIPWQYEFYRAFTDEEKVRSSCMFIVYAMMMYPESIFEFLRQLLLVVSIILTQLTRRKALIRRLPSIFLP